jgi:predicted Zn-ribbon and HTH transcriptional regulator
VVFRKELMELLRGRMVPLSELARLEGTKFKDLAADLEHLERSLRREGMRLTVEPAHCRKCGFVFTRAKFTRPGRCPKCKSDWIEDPKVGLAPT